MLRINRVVEVNQLSWTELKQAADAGNLDKVLHSGDTLGITLKNGEAVTLVVGTDEKGNMLFSTQDCLRDERRMNSTMTNHGGWEATEMRRYLNEDVFALLPDELQTVIRPTTIVQIVDGKRVETQDKLFLFSATQVFGRGSYSENEPEDTQLDIFRREKDRVKECNTYGTWFWWLRSASSNDINYFCYVYYNGITTPAMPTTQPAWRSASRFNPISSAIWPHPWGLTETINSKRKDGGFFYEK